jgi:hypothetical protein
MTGTIPTEIGLISSLSGIRLLSKELSGPIPTELGSAIELVDARLHLSAFTGTELGQLRRLPHMDLLQKREACLQKVVH